MRSTVQILLSFSVAVTWSFGAVGCSDDPVDDSGSDAVVTPADVPATSDVVPDVGPADVPVDLGAPDTGPPDVGPPDTGPADSDSDGVKDDVDNCPSVANANQLDTDGDQFGDACDPDDDGDKIADADDCEPLDPDVHPGALEVCDGKDNDCDGQTDRDGPLALCTKDDPDKDGVLSDGDASGIIGDAPCPNEVTVGCDDNCPAKKNAGQEDLDGDGLGDSCDPDKDGDGVLNGGDCDPLDPLVITCTDPDPDDDGVGSDGNGSGIPFDSPCNTEQQTNCDDNCPLIKNTDQTDTDDDGFGDACDDDDDEDGVPDGSDCAPLDPSRWPGAPELCDGQVNDCGQPGNVTDAGASCGEGEACLCGGCRAVAAPECETFEAGGTSWVLCSGDSALAWTVAGQSCIALGGRLAQPSDVGRHAALGSQLTGPTWIGLSEAEGEAQWRWADGVFADPTFWCADHPTGAGGLGCAAVSGADGCWQDCGCDGAACGVQAYACEVSCE